LEAAENLQFEKAAILRDQIDELKKGGPGRDSKPSETPVRRQVKYDKKLKVNVVKKNRPAKAQ
jgi:excinuclease UvrABC nuclease subunit